MKPDFKPLIIVQIIKTAFRDFPYDLLCINAVDIPADME